MGGTDEKGVLRVKRLDAIGPRNFALDERLALSNPRLAGALQGFRAVTPGTPRSAIHMPTLLSDPAPTAVTLFKNPDDGTAYQLGVYDFAYAQVGQRRAKWVELRPDGDTGYVLEVHLVYSPLKFVDLHNMTRSAVDLPVDLPPSMNVPVECYLRATLKSNKLVDVRFPTIVVKDTAWTLTLPIQGSDTEVRALLGDVFAAMTDSADAKLVIRRTLSLAIERPAGAATEVSTRPFLLTPPRMLDRRAFAPMMMMMRPDLGGLPPHRPVVDPDDPPPPRFPPHPRPVPVTVPPPPAPPPPAPPPPAPPPPAPPPPAPPPPPPPTEPSFDVAPHALETAVDFSFSKDLDASVFAQLPGNVSTTTSGINHYKVLWQPDPAAPGTWHSYFQDAFEPRAVYFLPDEFRVVRRIESPHRPWLKLSVLDKGARLSLDYIAVPTWDAARVSAALAELKAKQSIPDDLPPIQLFPAATTSLRLKLPKGDASGGAGFIPQPGANIAIPDAINGSIALLVEDCKAVVDAIVSDTSDLMSGFVDVTVDDEVLHVPFTARVARFTGPLCDYTSVTDAAGTTLSVTATNPTESALVIPALPIAFARGSAAVTLDAGPVALPVTLAPGEALVQTFTAAEGGVTGLAIQPDEDALVARPEASAFLDAILESSVSGQSSTHVTFTVFEATFIDTPTLLMVQLEFENSALTVSFPRPATGAPPNDTGSMAQGIEIPVPLRAYLLGLVSGTVLQYRYRVRRIFRNGEQKIDAQYTTDSRDTVFVTVPSD